MDVEGEDVVHHSKAHCRSLLGGVNETPVDPAVTPPPSMEQPEVKAH